VYSFDFRGLGETRMNYRGRSADDPQLLKENFDEAYTDPLLGVLADCVYNSLLTGRPYFLQLIDDLKIAALFIRSQGGRALPIQIAAAGDAHTLATHFTEIEPDIKVLPDDRAPSFDWAELMKKKQEQWPIVYVLPFGALLRGDNRLQTSIPANLNSPTHASPQ
jgi:hypothetical protein